MRFRAELRDPTATRETKPEQAFSNNPAELEEWSIQTLVRHSEGCEVAIFESIEKPFRLVTSKEALDVIDQRAQAEAVSAAAKSKQVGLPRAHS